MKKTVAVFLFVLFAAFSAPRANAQCPMCKTSVESAMKDKNNKKGKGLNTGILYLLSMPYLAVGVVGLGWYMNSRKKKKRIHAI